tara:strand:- start:110 stop:343 length:234 start_codon:yes stop_codon:yes gene_type:complete
MQVTIEIEETVGENPFYVVRVDGVAKFFSGFKYGAEDSVYNQDKAYARAIAFFEATKDQVKRGVSVKTSTVILQETI